MLLHSSLTVVLQGYRGQSPSVYLNPLARQTPAMNMFQSASQTFRPNLVNRRVSLDRPKIPVPTNQTFLQYQKNPKKSIKKTRSPKLMLCRIYDSMPPINAPDRARVADCTPFPRLFNIHWD